MQKRFERALAAFQSGSIPGRKKAGAICEKLLASQPDHIDALHLSGLIAFKDGNGSLAIERILASIALNPDQPSAWNNLGNIENKKGNFHKANDHYRKAIELAPDLVDAWANMGSAYLNLQLAEEGIAACSRALQIDPGHFGAMHILGMVYMHNGDLDEAAATFKQCTELQLPTNISPMWYAGRLVSLGRYKEAMVVLEERLSAHPEDQNARHRLDALQGNQTLRTPDDAVRGIFDSFAESFDVSLARLDYRGPQLVADCLLALMDGPVETIADLGCGTGLMAPLISGQCERLIGVDLSAGMLSQAHWRGGYSDLHEADLIGFLNQGEAAQFDHITCADTLCYIGDLEDAFHGVRRCLKPGGYFVATTEKIVDGMDVPDQDGYCLNVSGRYAHRQGYIEKFATGAGLELTSIKTDKLRKELGKYVVGLVFAARIAG